MWLIDTVLSLSLGGGLSMNVILKVPEVMYSTASD